MPDVRQVGSQENDLARLDWADGIPNDALTTSMSDDTELVLRVKVPGTSRGNSSKLFHMEGFFCQRQDLFEGRLGSWEFLKHGGDYSERARSEQEITGTCNNQAGIGYQEVGAGLDNLRRL